MNISPSSIVSFYRSNPRTLHLHLGALVFLVAGIVARRFNSGDAGFYYGFVAFCALAGVLHTWAYERWQMPKAPAPSKEKTESPENEERRRTPPMPKGFWQKRAGFTLLVLIIGVLCFLLSRKMTFGGSSWWQIWKIGFSLKGGWENLPAFIVFPMAGLVWKAWRLWVAVPKKQYKLWYYPDSALNMDIINYVPVLIRLSRQMESSDIIQETMRSPRSEKFGDVFQYFIFRYNTTRAGNNPIAHKSEQYDKTWGWQFYLEPKGFRWWRIYLDPDKTVAENGLKIKGASAQDFVQSRPDRADVEFDKKKYPVVVAIRVLKEN